MSPKVSDGWLWVSLAILGYVGSFAVHRQLVAIRLTSEVTRHDKRPDISQQTEDALKLKSLAELTQSPDQNIRAASVKIITDRAIRDEWDLFIRDIAGMDIERRDKALACLGFLCPSFPGNEQADVLIRRHSTYKATVDCLCNLLPEATIAEKDPTCRTQSERNAIYFLDYILHLDFANALEAGMISRWLVQYPFGGAEATRCEKKEAIKDIIDNGLFYEDIDFRTIMRAILWVMKDNPLMRKEMVEHGLLDFPEVNDVIVDVEFARCGKRTGTDCTQDDWDKLEATGIYSRIYSYEEMTPRWIIPIRTSDRPREESFEEQALRRRRREAMVLGEIGRPIERADIIERDSMALDEFRSIVMPLQFDGIEVGSEQPVTAVADEEDLEDLETLD